MEGCLLMSMKERKRKSIFDRVKDSQMTIKTAACLLGLSYRQCRRSYKRFKEQGDAGLVHRSRGRPSCRSKPESFKKKVLARYKERYEEHEFGPTFAAEKLAKDGLKVDHETLRRWLLAAGQWKKRRKRREHRTRRVRKHHFGEAIRGSGHRRSRRSG